MSGDRNPLRVLVVGGGVAGGLVAGWLSRHRGVDVKCLERVTADDHANAGNGLNIGPNATALLETVFPDKVAELREASLPWRQWLALHADGSPAYEIPLAEVAERPGLRIRWSELYRLARSSADSVIAYETEVTELHASGRRLRVCYEQSGGASVCSTYDLVIATEGRYSGLRTALTGMPIPEHLGIANFRTLIDDGGSIPIDDMVQWFNGHCRIIAFRLADGRIYVSGNLPLEPGAPVPAEMKDKAFLRAAYTPESGVLDPRLAALIDAFCAPESEHHWARAQAIETLWNAVEGRVLFLGDAAHAMAPTLGQGATQAIEDAAAFLRLFRAWEEQGGSWENVPQLSFAFHHLRAERTEFVKTFSADASDVLQESCDFEAALAKKSTPQYREKLQQLYEDLPLSENAYLAALAAGAEDAAAIAPKREKISFA